VSTVCLATRDVLLVFVHDITRRRQTEERLRSQGAALDAAANAIVITDREGVLLWANPAFAALTGYSVAEALGRRPQDLVRSGRHDAAFYRRLWETILAGQVWHDEIVNRRKDGSFYEEEMTITPVRDDRGEITHFVAIKQDVTARKQLQAQFLQAQKMESVGLLGGAVRGGSLHRQAVRGGEPHPEGSRGAGLLGRRHSVSVDATFPHLPIYFTQQKRGTFGPPMAPPPNAAGR